MVHILFVLPFEITKHKILIVSKVKKIGIFKQKIGSYMSLPYLGYIKKER